MDLFEAVEKRRSIRKFKTDPVPVEDLKKILEAGRLAPSGGNHQPWSFVVVRDSETKKALANAANLQRFIADAGIVLVALGDPSVSRSLHRQDPMIAIEHMVLAATALGYGTCWIGAFNEDEVKKIVKVPENLVVIALLPIGVPDEKPLPRPRKAFKEVFFKEAYGKPLEI
jgi:nitroreductase